MNRSIQEHEGESVELKILATEAGKHLANAVCKHLETNLTLVDHRRCADGEYVPQIMESIRDKHTVLICPTSPQTDRNLMDAMIMGDAIARSAPGRLTLLFPYWGYNRQDRKDKPHVPMTAKLASDMISMLCPNNILFFDVHSEATLGYFPRSIKVDHLYSSAISVNRLRELVEEPFVVAGPDKGAGPRTAYYARLLGKDKYAIFEKRRGPDGKIDPAFSRVIGNVEDRDVILIDDMVDSGGTVNIAASTAKLNGARNIYLFATHGVFSGNAMAALEAGDISKIVVTDSIYHDPATLSPKIEILSIASFLADAVSRIHEGRSLSALIP
jgi:ribose-phosphate pyrophosphokinase